MEENLKKKKVSSEFPNYNINAINLFMTNHEVYPDIDYNHTCFTLRKSVCQKAYQMYKNKINDSLTTFRQNNNIMTLLVYYYVGLYYGYFEFKELENNVESSVIHCGTEDILDKKVNWFRWNLYDKRPYFFCINTLINNHCLTIFNNIKQHYIRTFDKYYKEKKSKKKIKKTLIFTKKHIKTN